MIEGSDGLPAVGPSGRMLGVRPGNSATPDVVAIQADEVVVPGGGGMSVAPDDPLHLPKHRRPLSLGGKGQDAVWWIEAANLGPELQLCPDRPGHGLIEPSRPMTLQEFQEALARTRDDWVLHCK